MKSIVAMLLIICSMSVFAENFVLKRDNKSIATGITICFKNKKLLEKKFNQPAISDFIAHLFEIKSKEFEDEFRLIGAELQFYDYPFIPFDDYYTNDYFGFIRIRVLPENTDKAIELTAKLINAVLNFNERDFEIAKKSTIGSNIMRNRGKERAKREIWGSYFPDSFVSLPDYSFNPRFTVDKVRYFLKEYLDKSNTFVSIYGNFNQHAVHNAVFKNFSSKKENAVQNKLPVRRLSVHKKIVNINSKQALVYIVYPIKDKLSVDEYARLMILTANCSDKIAFQIREKEGLAYFIGSKIVCKGDHLFFVGYCGTNPEKADYVLGKMADMIKNYMLSQVIFKGSEIDRIVNSLVFSNILKTLPNVNKSFFNALFELSGNFYYNKNILDKALKKEKIKRLCGKEFLDVNNNLYLIIK